MGKYLIKRLCYMLAVLLILSLVMYLVYAMIPFDRARAELENYRPLFKNDPEGLEAKYEELRRELGLDRNVFMQYLGWLGAVKTNGEYRGILQGNFGYSYVEDRPARELLREPLKNTVLLNSISTAISLVITLFLGIYAARRRGSRIDSFISASTVVGYSVPTFIVAILFVWFFALKLGIFPVSGMKTPGSSYTGLEKLLDTLRYTALPVIVLVFSSLGGMTRYVRAAMGDALSQDHIRTARAKGLSERQVVYTHALRNAMIPILTVMIAWLVGIFSGSIMVENIFGLNGMGRVYLSALSGNDYEVVLLLQMFYVTVGLLGNLLSDIAYGLVDPRIRLAA